MFCAFNRVAAASASSSVSPATKRCTMPFDIPFCTKVRLTLSFSASASITVRPFNIILHFFLIFHLRLLYLTRVNACYAIGVAKLVREHNKPRLAGDVFNVPRHLGINCHNLLALLVILLLDHFAGDTTGQGIGAFLVQIIRR